jgi:hypothetical protein
MSQCPSGDDEVFDFALGEAGARDVPKNGQPNAALDNAGEIGFRG